MFHLRSLPAVFLSLFFLGSAVAGDGYTVVVSKQTNAAADWGRVVKTLVAKHDAELLVFDGAVSESIDGLRKRFPRYLSLIHI